MTSLPANVRIVDLPVASTVITGTELFEAVQTVGGVGESVQIALSQMITASLGGLPTGGVTGQVLNKSSGSNYSTAWTNISSLVVQSTGITVSGSTSILISANTQTGLSLMGVSAAATAVPAAIGPGAAAQVVVVNDAGSGVEFGAVNLGSSAAVTGLLPLTSATGILPVTKGGIGTSIVGSGLVVGNAPTGALSIIDYTTAGLVLISAGSNSPAIWTSAAQGTVTSVITGWGLVGGPITALGTVSIATTNPPYGLEAAINLALAASTAGSALTIAVKNNAATDPSATNPVLFPFRSSTLSNGAPVWRSATAALSLTISQGAVLGALSGNPLRGWITAHDTGTTPTIGVINCVGLANATTASQVYALPPTTLQTTTAMSASAASAGIYYSAIALNNAPFMVLGYFEYNTMTTAGQYINVPDKLQLFGTGVKRPGDAVAQYFATNNASTSTTNSSTSPTNTQLSKVISMVSPANVIRASYHGLTYANTSAAAVGTRLLRGAVTLGGTYMQGIASFPISQGAVGMLDIPATTAPLTYQVQVYVDGTGTAVFANVLSNGAFPPLSTLSLEEIMG